MKLRKFLAMLLAVVMLLSLSSAIAVTDEDDGLTDVVTRILDRYKLDGMLSFIEDYSLYNYEGDDELLKTAIVDFFAKHPEMFEEFANGLFATQDKYSHYMEPSTYDSSYVLDESFVGIGIELDAFSGGTIAAVIPGSPAEEVGLKAGDVIFSVDGEVLDDTYYTVIRDKIRGEEGKEVTVGVMRGDRKLEFTIVRRFVKISNISFKDMGNGIAYLRISRFGDMPTTFFDFVNTYSELDDAGFTSVIFDVRDNTGGSLDTLLNILNYTFWDKQVPMFTLCFRDDEPATYYSLGAGWEPENIVVLTNANTASAAEIFAGALGYIEGAWIVGEDEYSYGKGVGQTHMELTDGSYMIVTSMEILIGDSIHYNEVGIPADTVVDPSDYDAKTVVFDELQSWLEMYVGAKGKNARAVEQRLYFLGYIDDPADGVLSADDFAAIEQFRDDYGLKHRDYVDCATMERLDYVAGISLTSDAALITALELCGAFD